MMKYLVLTLTAITLLAGCASKLGQIEAPNWNKLHLGMTRAEVIQELGPPRMASAQHNMETLIYVEDKGVFITKGTGIFKRYHVDLIDGKVDAYGVVEPVAPPANPPAMDNRRSEIDAPLRVTKICEDGNQMRLKFFDDGIEYLQQHGTNGNTKADIDELKQLRAGEIGLQRSLATFTKYVVAGKPYAVTAEEIQDSLADSQKRSSFFEKTIGQIKADHANGSLAAEDYNREWELLNAMEQQDVFLQRVLVGFSQEKAAFEQRAAGQSNGQVSAAGGSTFQQLLNFAIAAKLMQNQQPNTIVIKRY
jgi:hypothetical protein